MAENFQSEFVFGLQGRCYQDFVDTVASPIIEQIIKTDDYEIIGFDKHLSFVDFDHKHRKQSIFPEFYLNFLADITKDANGVSFKKKVCITLDERLCNDICPNTGRKITAIKIGGVELAYFIYFDIKEFFDFAYMVKSSLEDCCARDVCSQSLDLKAKDSSAPASPMDMEEVCRVGYVCSINDDKYCFVVDSKDGDSGFPIPYKSFPKAKSLSIGATVKAVGVFNGGEFYVNDFEIGDMDDLPFQILTLNGTLMFDDTAKYVIIKTALGGVYTTRNLIKNYSANTLHRVKCIAVEAFDYKRQKNGWRAIHVF